ncbi:MAG: signal peptidase II, partial [Bacteroidota bacterium]
MNSFVKRLLVVLGVVAVTVVLDQWTKQLAIEHLQGSPDHLYLGGLFRLTFVENTGAFLSLGAN